MFQTFVFLGFDSNRKTELRFKFKFFKWKTFFHKQNFFIIRPRVSYNYQ